MKDVDRVVNADRVESRNRQVVDRVAVRAVNDYQYSNVGVAKYVALAVVHASTVEIADQVAVELPENDHTNTVGGVELEAYWENNRPLQDGSLGRMVSFVGSQGTVQKEWTQMNVMTSRDLGNPQVRWKRARPMVVARLQEVGLVLMD